MEIKIDIDEALFDMANKSHGEMLAEVADPEERYRYEAGTEKRDEALRCLEEAVSRLDIALKEYEIGPAAPYGDNAPHLGEDDTLVYSFPPSARRYGSQAPAMAGLIHSHLVDSALALFYAGVGRKDNAATREALAQAGLENIRTCLLSKARPVRSIPYKGWQG